VTVVSHARTLAKAALEVTADHVSKSAISAAKTCVLDYLGATLAGMDENPSQIVRKWVLEQGGKPASTILGTGGKVPANLAAMANGTAGHMIELDDVHGACIGHPAVAVIPAALALSESLGLNGLDFLCSVIAGYEVMARLGSYMGISHYKVWHPTATLGSVGAAAAASRALGLDEDCATNALAIASTMASGLREVFVGGSNCKHVHPGLAARNGVVAAELASAGFTGPESAIEGTMGYRVAHSGAGNEDALSGLPGGKMHIEDTEFKIFASCRSAHTAAEAGILVKEAGVEPEEVRSIVLELPEVTAKDPAWGSLDPRNPLAAKLSIAYNFVVALMDGACYLQQFTPERVNDPHIGRLLGLTSVKPSAAIDAYYPEHVGVRATVSLLSGGQVTKQVFIPKGHPERPLPASEIDRKFLGLVRPVLGRKTGELRNAVMNLDEMEDTGALLALCAIPGFDKAL
jgi:2-methylcitrate dehydratase PrpD